MDITAVRGGSSQRRGRSHGGVRFPWLALGALALALGPAAGCHLTSVSTRISAPDAGQEMELEFPGGASLRFVWVPPGSFPMGAEASEPNREIDEALHEVTISRGFWLGKFEVTNLQFRAFRPDHRSRGMQGEKGEFDGDDQPVVCVGWEDAVAFCRWASEVTGREVRLPTEAEWEYACRAGSRTTYSYGDEHSRLGDYCWYSANSGGQTHPVGTKLPNAWGLHDMHGNVAEWVSDWYTYYPDGSGTDPVGPADGQSRAWRECSWSSDDFECRCATRDYALPSYASAALGFRVACETLQRS